MGTTHNIPHPDLVEAIDAYCEAEKIPASKFGEMCLRDPNLYWDLLKGRELRKKSRDRVQAVLNRTGRET